jgi:hypothetical protein
VALFKVASDTFSNIKVAGVESVCWQQPLNVSGGCLTVLEIEAVFQSLGPCFNAPVLTSPSG